MGIQVDSHAVSAPSNERRVHLDALRAAIDTRRELACGMVERRGMTWVSVVGVGGARRLVEVGCDYVRSAWWFVWDDGRRIAPVSDVQTVVDLLVDQVGGA
jgi:hypothetical protein